MSFVRRNGLIYRVWRPSGTDTGDIRTCEQLVLPRRYRATVLRLAHDIPLRGHLGITKTKDRILARYYWPGVFQDVARYCRTCEVCQRSGTRKLPKASMIPMPLMERPFQRIAMDLVGPLPRTKKGNRFILVLCDYATRYPEAIPLSSTEAPRIAKELVGYFAHFGIPGEILTDQGTNSMSALLEEAYLLLQIKRIRTSPYHPQTDRLVERFNGTLKSMLRKFTSRRQNDWDEYLTFCSPIGRCPKSPLDSLHLNCYTVGECEDPWMSCVRNGQASILPNSQWPAMYWRYERDLKR